MPSKLIYASALLCERILEEKDNVLTLIRVVDLFGVPSSELGKADIQFFLVLSLRAEPYDTPFTLGITLIGTDGVKTKLPPPPAMPYKFAGTPDSLVGGFAFVSQLLIKPTRFGVCYIELEMDGEVIMRVPFTIRPVEPQISPAAQ